MADNMQRSQRRPHGLAFQGSRGLNTSESLPVFSEDCILITASVMPPGSPYLEQRLRSQQKNPPKVE